MKKIVIFYWISKVADLPWEQKQELEYSKELRNQIMDECLDKGYDVMVRKASKEKGWDWDGELICIDNKRFTSR